MATAVFFHAHPDDETIATGGTMARAAAEGHRVVLVTATAGELGEVPDGFLAPGEDLASRRAEELAAACQILGVARHLCLGYGDSGMAGEPSNDVEGSFWRADVDEAAAALAAVLEEEQAEVLTAYDEHGGYGHPDHIQVHRVGLRAGEMARTPRVYMATINRDHVQRLAEQAGAFGVELPEGDAPDFADLGVEEARITTSVDVSEFLGAKRRAMEAHASQIAETSFFLAVPPEAFAVIWGTEWYIRQGAAPGGEMEYDLLPSP
ncbi:MAG TPA: GlcNAc-PI de-N-acetylase [Acidimicrobiaceae bacterium]|nr:GlcNAc-PI de-N-acetylase [Acidimicrobiaceae bacterium]